MIACFGSLGTEAKSIHDHVANGKDLTCYVCNSVLGSCDPKDVKPINCKTEFLDKTYGTVGKRGNTLKSWPQSLSELAVGSPHYSKSELGWTLGDGFPSAYVEGSKFTEGQEDTHQFSSFANVEAQKNPKDSLILDKGYRSCKVMTISTENQINGNKRNEIPKTEPRVIRTCSFVAASKKKKDSDDSWNEKGCRKFLYKTAMVEVCYCDEKKKDKNGKLIGCNGSPYIRMSPWMIAVSILVLLTQIL